MLRARAVVMAVTMQRLAAVRVGVPRVVYGVRSAKVSQKRGLVHGHLAQRPWVSPELGFGFARPRTRWFAAVAEGGVEGVAEGVAEGVHGVESGVDSVASGVLGVQDKSSSEPTPPAKYQPPPGNYAGAGATVHHDDVHLGDSGHVVLVDGMSVIFRSFYGWQARGAPLLDSNGVDISVLYSVAHAVLAVLELPSVSHCAVVFDAKGKTFRHEMFSDYKANRPETPDGIKEVIPRVIDMVTRMGIPVLSMSGVEADDIIGTVSRRAVGEANLKVTIVSPDKDFFQLLGPRVRQLRPNGRNKEVAKNLHESDVSTSDGDDTENGVNAETATGINTANKIHWPPQFHDYDHPNLAGKGLVPYTECDFRNEFGGLDPVQFVDLLAMVGDASDNVPGVEGIGPKTAPKLLNLYGNIEGCVHNASTTSDIKNKRVRENLASQKGKATALLCRSLVKIRTQLSAPTLNAPALPFSGPNSLDLANRVPPNDGGVGVGEYLERVLELSSAAERWREVCRKRSAQ